MALWAASSLYANWLEGRENRHGSKTWLVTVFDEHAGHFLDAARAISAPVTVELIDSADDTERYMLEVGKPGTGWAES